MSELCGYQGEPGAFSEHAARRLVGAVVPLFPCRDFAALFAAVEVRRVHWAVVPLENTLAGPVPQCRAWLEKTRVTIVGELSLPIVLALIAGARVQLADVREVWSHPVALAQCRKLFAEYPRMQAREVHDTAGAVREVLETGRPDAAALANARAAEIYGGRVLLDDVGDRAENYTRFVLVTLA
ncbi:MAG: prephenate dehydratase domain-containing protein [Gammaproteobacteria bacterium]